MVEYYEIEHWSGWSVPVKFGDGISRNMAVKDLTKLRDQPQPGELHVVPVDPQQLVRPARSPARRKAAPGRKSAGAA